MLDELIYQGCYAENLMPLDPSSRPGITSGPTRTPAGPRGRSERVSADRWRAVGADDCLTNHQWAEQRGLTPNPHTPEASAGVGEGVGS